MNAKLKLGFLIIVIGVGHAGYQLNQFENEEVTRLDAELKGLQSQLSGKQTQLQKLQNFAENIERIKQELRELNIQLQTATEHMPRTFELSNLLRKLSKLSQNSGVELIDFSPSGGETPAPGNFYATTDINLRVRGSFAQSLLFFDQLTRMKRIISIKSIEIRPSGDQRRQSRGAAIGAETSSTIVAYRFAE